MPRALCLYLCGCLKIYTFEKLSAAIHLNFKDQIHMTCSILSFEILWGREGNLMVKIFKSWQKGFICRQNTYITLFWNKNKIFQIYHFVEN